MRTITGVALIGLLTVAGCARGGQPAGPAADAEPPTDSSLVSGDYEGRFRTVGAVLESPEHGPQLCHTVAESYPPQCGGPDIIGWDWSAVVAESANGTTWGNYEITGTWDGEMFTLTEPAVASTGSVLPDYEGPFGAPCPEPAGGWPSLPTELDADPVAFEAALAAVHELPDVSGTWVDQGGTRDDATPVPGQFVLVVRTTGDVPAMEAAVREVWSGALCVVGGGRFTEAGAREIEAELGSGADVIGAAVDEITERVEVTVYVATEARQRDLDERYGTGVVDQVALFEPLD